MKKIIIIAIMACCTQVAVAQNNNRTPLKLDETPARTPIIKKKRALPVMQVRNTAELTPVQKQPKVINNDRTRTVRMQESKAPAKADVSKISIKQQIANRRLATPNFKAAGLKDAPIPQKVKPMPKEEAVDW